MCDKMSLQRALENLGLAPDVQEVAGVESPREPLAGVPKPRADGAGFVAQLQVEIEVALSIGAELLVGDEEVFDRPRPRSRAD